jgi:hypothetical protein
MGPLIYTECTGCNRRAKRWPLPVSAVAAVKERQLIRYRIHALHRARNLFCLPDLVAIANRAAQRHRAASRANENPRNIESRRFRQCAPDSKGERAVRLRRAGSRRQGARRHRCIRRRIRRLGMRNAHKDQKKRRTQRASQVRIHDQLHHCRAGATSWCGKKLGGNARRNVLAARRSRSRTSTQFEPAEYQSPLRGCAA